MKNDSDFRTTPCAGENVRVVGAILLPAIVRRRPDFMINLPAHFLFENRMQECKAGNHNSERAFT